MFSPSRATGCSNLHLFTYGPPDGGNSSFGTFTVDDSLSNPQPQQNTYGPDVSVNVADGSVCTSSGGVTGPTATSTPTQTVAPTMTPTMTPTPVATATSTSTSGRCADLNGDGRVTGIDVLIELLETRKKHAPARYDFNGDGRVDAKDVIIVARQLGHRC